MAALNKVAGPPLTLASKDVQIGMSTQQANGSWTFTNGGTKPNSVRINAQLSQGSASGPISLTFGKVFGAGSFQPTKTSTASVLQQEICLVIDRSASMAWDLSGSDWSYPTGGAYDKPPHPTLSRWAVLNSAVNNYLNIISTTAIDPRIAMVTWSSDMRSDPLAQLVGLLANVLYSITTLDNPLNLNHQNIKDVLAQRGNNIILGGTNMAAGLDDAITLLNGPNVYPFAKRNIILMTDGQWNMGRSPLLSAQDAVDAGITIYVITFLPGANSADMDQIAAMTGGKHYHADNAAELNAAFVELARTLPVVLTD
jgi:hypothetical protein